MSTTTYQQDYENLLSGNNAAGGDEQIDAKIAVSFAAFPQPSLNVLFPFRDSTASVSMVVGENGHVHVTSQNVLDDANSVGTNGQPRRAEQLGKALEMFGDIGRWVHFIRTRWAK
jgi:cytochrome c oxidase assembly protein Cox11